MKKFFLFASVSAAFPRISFAQPGSNVFTLMQYIVNLINQLQWLFWGAAVTLFVFGLVKFIRNAGDTAAHEEGKSFMIWGLVSFFVLVTLWAIVNFILYGSLGISTLTQPGFVNKSGGAVR